MGDDYNERLPALWANIPAAVLYDKELKPSAKLIYGVISSMAISRGYCFATNKYIGSQFALKPKSVSEIISDLAKKKYIIVELIPDENGTTESRKIWIDGSRLGLEYPPVKNGGSPPQKPEAPPEKNGKTPPQKPEEIYTRKISKVSIAPKAVIDKLESYSAGSSNLHDALFSFAEMRSKIKAPISTEATANLLLNKLDKLSGGNDRVKIEMLNEAIEKNWKSVYAPKDGSGAPAQVKEAEGFREWND